jgi:hypothetical protein
MENLKLYTYDCAWCGAVVCVAKSKEEAIEKFKNTDAYCISYNGEFNEHYVEEHELNEVVDVGGDY